MHRYTLLQSVQDMPIGPGYYFLAPGAVASTQQQSRFWLETSLMSDFEAQQFGARVGLPVFLVRQVCTTIGGDPVSFSRIVYRSDAVQIVFER